MVMGAGFVTLVVGFVAEERINLKMMPVVASHLMEGVQC